jgi:hypothetical protein
MRRSMLLLVVGVVTTGCAGGAAGPSIMFDSALAGSIAYATIDPQKVVVVDLRSGEQTTLYQGAARYKPDWSMPWAVGYLAQTGEVVTRKRIVKENTTQLFARNMHGVERLVTEFPDVWVIDVSSLPNAIGVVLSRGPILRHPDYGDDLTAMTVTASGEIQTLIRHAAVAGAPTCDVNNNCYVAVHDAKCAESDCDDVLVSVSGKSVSYLEFQRGMAPVLSPAGQFLAMLVRKDTRTQVYKIFHAGRREQLAILGSGANAPGVWSPDEAYFAFVTGSTPPWWSLEVWRKDGVKVAQYRVPYRCEVLAWLRR